MSRAATREYMERTRTRYGKMKTRKARSRILDEFCATTGYERKHAIKRLSGSTDGRATGSGRRGGRLFMMKASNRCSRRSG